eukprot:jgi/Tetstr1/424953/TSEL_015446.t1
MLLPPAALVSKEELGSGGSATARLMEEEVRWVLCVGWVGLLLCYWPAVRNDAWAMLAAQARRRSNHDDADAVPLTCATRTSRCLAYDLERRIKAAAAAGEPQWRGVGKEPGVQVWRIEQLKVVPGGADSGFRHVAELKQPAVLLRVNGERGREVVKYVAPGRAALYSGDARKCLLDASKALKVGKVCITTNVNDSGSNDIQWIKPSAVKPTLDLATVPVWDQNISTRDNAQAVKISLSSAGYLDTTKGKGTHQEQLILLAVLRHATANYPMALAIVDIIIMDSKKCGHATWTALFT